MLVERRKHERMPLNRPATVLWDANYARCFVSNISVRGARVRLERAALVPERFTLALAANGQVARHCRVIWRSPTDIGVTFEEAAASPTAAPPDSQGVALDC